MCLILVLASYMNDVAKHSKEYAANEMRTRAERRTSFSRMKSMFDKKYALEQMGEGSVYSFFVHQNVLGWFIGLLTCVAQIWMLYPFITDAEIDFTRSQEF